jgi:upstream activation factor subunit UAF30
MPDSTLQVFLLSHTDILKDADLSEMSAKKVRLQLEEKLSCDLSARKKEVDELVMEFVNSQKVG